MSNEEALVKARELFGDTAYVIYSSLSTKQYVMGWEKFGFGKMGIGSGSNWEEAIEAANKFVAERTK